MATKAQNLALLGGNVDASGEVDSNTVDGIDSSQFLRSDTDDVMNGQLTIRQAEGSGNGGGLILQESGNQMHRFWVDNQYQYNQIGSSAGTWIWTNSNGEQARLTESGNLFIGGNTDASPYNNTTGEGIVLGSGHMWAAADSESVLDLNRMSSDGKIINFYRDGVHKGGIGVDATQPDGTENAPVANLFIGAGDTGFGFTDDGDFIYPYDYDSLTPSNGIITLGHSSKKFKDAWFSGTVNASKLDVAATTSSALRMERTGNIVGIELSGGASTGWGLYDYAASQYELWMENGSVGIGTTSPAAKLHSNIATVGDASLRLSRTGSSAFEFQQGISGVTGDALLIKDVSLSYDYLTLRSGNVGIGTNEPSAKLDINRGDGGGELLRLTSTSGEGKYIKFYDDGGTGLYRNFIVGVQQNLDKGFEITPADAAGSDSYSTPALVVREDRKVGINTSEPVAPLQVNPYYVSNLPTFDNVNMIINDRGNTSVDPGRRSIQFFDDDLDWTGNAYSSHWGMSFNVDGDQIRGGISYDHRAQEQLNIWSSYGDIVFKRHSTGQASLEPYAVNQEVLRLGMDGLVHPVHGIKPAYESNWEAASNGQNHFFSHGLGRVPSIIRIYFKVDGADNNKPHILVGDLGVWGNNSGIDIGVASAVSNSLIVVAIGEGGLSGDWGSTQNSNFPWNDNLLETYFAGQGQNSGADFIDTPTETTGTLNSGYFKVMAW